MAKITGGPGPNYCDKAHGAPCSLCILTALQTADRFFNVIIRPSYTPREMRRLKRIARQNMGPYTGNKPNGN